MVLRHLEIVSLIQYLSHERIKETIKQYSTIKEYAYILHDKDIDDKGKLKKPHYHVYLWFNSATDISQVATWFGIPENMIKKIKGRKKDVLKYLSHKNAPTKYQYDETEITTNIDLTKYTNDENDYSRLSDFNNYSYAEHINYLYETFKDKERIRAFEFLKANWLLHCEYLETKGNRNMKVIFINGVAGSGKTTYAKKLCETLKKDYYISSSNNDALGGYKGQKVLILDDARDSTFSFNDFLKLLDNHTSSSVRSRYNNKVFNGEIIIITSVVPLHEWYNGIDSKITSESKLQLYRRINEYFIMTKDDIKAYSKVSDDGQPNLLTEVAIPNFITALFLDNPSETLSIFAQTFKVFENDEKYGPLIKKRYTQIKKAKLPF